MLERHGEDDHPPGCRRGWPAHEDGQSDPHRRHRAGPGRGSELRDAGRARPRAGVLLPPVRHPGDPRVDVAAHVRHRQGAAQSRARLQGAGGQERGGGGGLADEEFGLGEGGGDAVVDGAGFDGDGFVQGDRAGVGDGTVVVGVGAVGGEEGFSGEAGEGELEQPPHGARREAEGSGGAGGLHRRKSGAVSCGRCRSRGGRRRARGAGSARPAATTFFATQRIA